MRDIWPTIAQLWREMAHLHGVAQTGNDTPTALCERPVVGGPSSNRAALNCQYRYPSPRRSDPVWVRPTPLFAVLSGEICRFKTKLKKMLVLKGQKADSGRNKTKQISMHKKGSNQCLNSVFFSPRLQSHHFPHVSTTTLSAALPAQQLVQSSLTHSVATLSQVPSLVAQLVHFVTKSRTSAAKTHPRFGAIKSLSRRSGTSLSGGFAFLRG